MDSLTLLPSGKAEFVAQKFFKIPTSGRKYPRVKKLFGVGRGGGAD
jgi:hypothetical protein